MTMGIVGDWDVRIKTPIGSLHTVYRFVEHEGPGVTRAGVPAVTTVSSYAWVYTWK